MLKADAADEVWPPLASRQAIREEASAAFGTLVPLLPLEPGAAEPADMSTALRTRKVSTQRLPPDCRPDRRQTARRLPVMAPDSPYLPSMTQSPPARVPRRRSALSSISCSDSPARSRRSTSCRWW